MRMHEPRVHGKSQPQHELRVLAVLCAGTFLFFNSYGSINVTLPTIQAELTQSLSAVQWVSTLGLVMSSSLALGLGRIGDILGRTRLYKAGVVLYALGAALSAAAQSFPELIGFRVIMTLGLSMAMPLASAILVSESTSARRGTMLGVLLSAGSIGRATGPAVGGVFLALSGWRAVFLANAAIPALLLALYLMSRPLTYPLLAMLPAALLVFHLRAYGVLLWSMAALAYLFVFLYGYYAIMALHRVSMGRFLAALILATLGSFTLASGQLIWLVGLISLLQQAAVRKSAHWAYVLCWTIAAAVVLSLWRLDLQTPNTLAVLVENLVTAPGHHVLYTLTLLGNITSESSLSLAASCGMFVLLALVISTLASWRSADIRLELCGWLVVLSVAAMVLGRSFTDVDYGLSSRYSVPSVLMAATTWVLLAARLQLRSPLIYLCIVMVCAGFNVYAYSVYGDALRPYLERRVLRFNRGHYPAWPHPVAESNAIVGESIRSGIYSPPARPMILRGYFPGLGTIAPSDPRPRN